MEILNNALKFTHKREHSEGGFTLYSGYPDTKNTYYGLLILQLFNEEPYNKENTIKWVEYLHKGRMYGIKGIFYRVNILKILGKTPGLGEKYFVKLIIKNEFPNFEIAYLHTSILKNIGYDKFDFITDWILYHQNEDGGFGRSNSNILSTYYALESLNIIDNNLIQFKKDILDFINKCQTEEGVFAYTPLSYPPYIEGVYAGTRVYEILGEKPIEINSIINFVVKLQNKDYGFRRSKYTGISELEYTFRALTILKNFHFFQNKKNLED